MIVKHFEIDKKKFDKQNYFLVYGENEGQKEDIIKSNFNSYTKENTFKYYEKDIIQNKQPFFDQIYSKSFFENEKLILIYDVTDKIEINIKNNKKLEEALNSNLDYIKGETLAIKLYFSENLNEGEKIEFDDIKTVITINKV